MLPIKTIIDCMLDYGINLNGVLSRYESYDKDMQAKTLAAYSIIYLDDIISKTDRNDINFNNTIKNLLHLKAEFQCMLDINPYHTIKEGLLYELENIHSINIYKTVTIKTWHEDVCRACRKYKDKKIDLEKAIREQPIPAPTCSNKLRGGKFGFCTCSYMPE